MSFPRKHSKSSMIVRCVNMTLMVQKRALDRPDNKRLMDHDRREIDAWLEIAQAVASLPDGPLDEPDLFNDAAAEIGDLSNLRNQMLHE